MGPYLLVPACESVLKCLTKVVRHLGLQGYATLRCSRAANEEAQLRNQKGSDIFAEPDALQTREVNQRKLQVATCCSLVLPLHVDVF